MVRLILLVISYLLSSAIFGESVYTDYAYVFCVNSNSIAQLGIKADGSVSPLPTPILKTGVGITIDGVGTTPNGKYIYFVNWNSNDISMYRVNSENGQLMPIDKTPMPSGVVNPFAITVDNEGQYAYVTGFLSNDISMFKINPDNGSLSLNRTATYPNGIIKNLSYAPTSLAMSNQKTLYVANARSNDITIYDEDAATGNIVLRESMVNTYGAGGRRVYIVNNSFLYVTNENSNNVSMYQILSNGDLRYNGLAPVGVNPIFFIADGAGKYAYVPNMQSNSISMFSINQDNGILTPLNTPEIYVNGLQPRNLYLRNQRLYLANQGDNSIEVFSISPDGSLDEIQYLGLPKDCINPRGMGFAKANLWLG